VNNENVKIEINSDIEEMQVRAVKELVINGNVNKGYIQPYFDKIIINGDTTLYDFYMPDKDASEEELREILGNYFYKLYTNTKREKLTINGDLTLRNFETSNSPESLYNSIEYVNLSGKLNVIN